MTNEAAMTYLTNYISEENKKASLEWLAEVEKQEGVMKTGSGLLYKIEKAGNIRVKATKDEDVVKAVYTGRTKDGQIFDSNRWSDLPVQRQEMLKRQNPRNEGKDTPIEFPLNGVIKGWTEGMKLIGKGGKITLWIPAELAYGERGAGRDIGPNEALRFDIELVDVIKK
jgi:FKBP-type peptidyl-prolyl cis-trans isomerase FkpA